MVTGGAREDTPISGRPVFFFVLRAQVTENHTALWTREGLVGAARHPGCPLLQWRLKLTTGDQSQHMCAIIKQRHALCLAESSNFRNRLRKEKKTLPHNDNLWRHAVDQFNGFSSINMIVIFSQWQRIKVDRVWATKLQRLATILDTATKYTHWPMTDMSPCIGRVSNNSIATSQKSQGNSRVGGIATDRTHIRLPGIKELDNLFCRHALDLVDIARPLVIAIHLIAFVGMTFGITPHKVGVLYTSYRLAGGILTGNQIDRLCLPPGVLLRNDVLDVADIYCHVFFSLRGVLGMKKFVGVR